MGSFKSTIITSRGHNLMAKLSSGTATMSFTKLKSSSHDYSTLTSTQLEALTSIEDIKQEVNVSEVTRINDASVKVSGTLVNTALTTGYYMKAIALYATDPDLGEILYSITASIESDWMPPYNSISSASALIDLITVVSNAENVSIDVNPNAIVSITQFNEFKESVNEQLSEITQLIKKDTSIMDDASIINNAITNGGIFLLDGDFIVGSSIRVKDNTTIRLTKGSSITLKNGANCYIFMNDDMTNGNKNITIEEFEMYGNGDNQTRNYTGNATTGYYGFGMLFYKVDGLKILDGYIDKTNAWGIAHFSCNNFEFKRLKFMQRPLGGLNGDGVTGTSSNGVIEDISGYTSDDMVCISSAGGSLQSNETGMPDIAVKNVVIRNIFPGTNGTKPSHIAIGIYARNNCEITNVTVDNVKGYTEQYLARILNYWPTMGEGIFNGIKFNNMERYNNEYTLDLPVIYVSTGEYNNLIFENIDNKNTSSQTKDLIYIDGDANITNLIANNMMCINRNTNDGMGCIVINSSTANIKNIFASNCEIINTNGQIADNIIYKSANPNLTKIYGSNLKSSDKEIYMAVDANISANAPSCRTNIDRLTGQEGDMVIDFPSDTSQPVSKSFSFGCWDYTTESISLLNSWVNYGDVNYYDAIVYKVGSIAYIKGLIKSGTMTSGTQIGSIPAGFAPKRRIALSGITNSGTGVLEIRQDGGIYITSTLPGNGYLSLDNISFPLI